MGAYNEIKNILKEKRGIEIEQLMFEVSQLFTFYHETGHIIQLYNMNLLNALGAENIISEQYNFIEDSEYDLLRHIKEFDADIHGSTHIANHIIALCIDLKGDMTYDNFFRLVVIFLVSISCYIMFLWQSFNKDMYYDEGTHPHPVIRLFWILATMLAYLEKPFFDLDQKAVLNEVNRVLSIFAENADLHDTIKHFDNIRNTEYQHIKNYCDKIMKDSESIEYLSVNTYLPYKYSK